VLAKGLPSLGIPSCYLALYEDPQPYQYPQPAPEWSRLILAYNEEGRVALEPGGWRFPTRHLLPEGMLPTHRRYTMVLQPLYFQDAQIGFALFEVGPQDWSVYDTLRAQISSALQGALLVQTRREAEERLKHYATELERSNQELEQFAHVASHDLQEPLRTVRSYLQLIERRYKEQLDEDADEFITFAVDGAERMRMLINDLLAYSRVTTHGKSFAPIDCSIVLDHALTNLKIAIEESNAVVTCNDLPTVAADETQLTRLLQNLIGNAIKFRKEETQPEIHVSAECTGDGWTFSVRDNGIGIDSKYFERIFMIFKRLHSREEYAGTGIGLTMCKKIVERHGGRIWVESEPSGGSTFYFTIPDGGSSAS
jgi:light-regulated signal transduction histidine kinase (bacteriophytochrome)